MPREPSTNDEDLVRKARKGEFPQPSGLSVKALLHLQRQCRVLRANGVKFDERALFTRGRYALAELMRLRRLAPDEAVERFGGPLEQDCKLASLQPDAPELLPPREEEEQPGEGGGGEGAAMAADDTPSPRRRRSGGNSSDEDEGEPESTLEALLEELKSSDLSQRVNALEEAVNEETLKQHSQALVGLKAHLAQVVHACETNELREVQAAGLPPKERPSLGERVHHLSSLLTFVVKAASAVAEHDGQTLEALSKRHLAARYYERPQFPHNSSKHLTGAGWLSMVIGSTMVQHADVTTLIEAHVVTASEATGIAAADMAVRRLQEAKDIVVAALANDRINNGGFPWQRVTKTTLEGLPKVIQEAYVAPNTGTGVHIWNDFASQVQSAVQQHLQNANLMQEPRAPAPTALVRAISPLRPNTPAGVGGGGVGGAGGANSPHKRPRSNTWHASEQPAAATPSSAKKQKQQYPPPYLLQEVDEAVQRHSVEQLDERRRRASVTLYATELALREHQHDGLSWAELSHDDQQKWRKLAWNTLKISEPWRAIPPKHAGTPARGGKQSRGRHGGRGGKGGRHH